MTRVTYPPFEYKCVRCGEKRYEPDLTPTRWGWKCATNKERCTDVMVAALKAQHNR